MPTESTAGSGKIPPGSHTIQVRVSELRQLFNAIDPSPFNERDLDSRAEEFIVDWSRDFPGDEPIALVVYLERAAGPPNECDALRDAIHEYFGQRKVSTQRKLRELFHRGRISLLIGLTALASSVFAGNALAEYFRDRDWSDILRESLLIGGWVAMWRPLEVFLYDWWPIRADARLYERLSSMPRRNRI